MFGSRSRVNDIAGELLGGFEALVFVGLVDAHQGIGPGFMGSANLFCADLLIVDDQFG